MKKVTQVPDSLRVKINANSERNNLLNATDFFVIRVDEELQTLVVTFVDNVLFQSVAQGFVNGGTAALSGFFYVRVADCTVAVGVEMRAQVEATHATLELVVTPAAEAVIV